MRIGMKSAESVSDLVSATCSLSAWTNMVMLLGNSSQQFMSL